MNDRAQAFAAFLAAHPPIEWEATDEAVFCGRCVVYHAGDIAPEHRPAAARLAAAGPMLARLALTMLEHLTASEARRRASADPADIKAAETERELADATRECLMAAGVLQP
jgi:hypothetical protein